MAFWKSLGDITVLEIGQNVAGPLAGSILGDLGARVIKIESPEGDPLRQAEPQLGSGSAAFFAYNSPKDLICLDLKSSDARPVLDRLIASVDVVIQNLRPGRAELFGVDANAVHAIDERIVHCSISAFYPSEGQRPGYDVLLQAESGILELTGSAGGEPCRVPFPVLDQATGMWAGLGICAALAGDRHKVALEVSLLDVAMNFLRASYASFSVDGLVPERMGAGLVGVAPHGIYETADGRIVLSAYTDRLFERLAATLGGAVLGQSRFKRLPDRLANRVELDGAIEELLGVQPCDHWLERLGSVGIPVATVRTFDDAVRRHESLSPTGVRDLGHARLVAPPLFVSGDPWTSPTWSATVGADSAGVLSSVGFDDVEIERLRRSGVVS